MRNLKVTAVLQTGQVISSDGFLPLDSILAAEWMRRNYPDLLLNDGIKTGELIEADLPLKRVEHPKGWYYACSFAQYEKQGEYIAHWHKRFDAALAEQHIGFGKRRGNVTVKSGRYKNYRMPVVVILADRLEWYCVGDIDGIRDLLNGVLAIGKKRSQGYGMVEEWIVEEWPEDWSEVGPDGKLMRAVHELPENVSGARMMMWGVRPPYWFRENQKVMCLP